MPVSVRVVIALLMAVISSGRTAEGQIVVFFDPQNDSVTTPPSSVPARSGKIDDVTRKWLCGGHSPEEQASLLQQVADAEAKQKSSYFISVPSGTTRSSTG